MYIPTFLTYCTYSDTIDVLNYQILISPVNPKY